MVAVSAEHVVNASQQLVFTTATDAERMDQWQHGVSQVRRLDGGPVRVGSRVAGERRIAGLSVRFTSVITAWEPPRRYAFRVVARGFTAEGEQRVEALGPERSLVRARLEVHPPAVADVGALQQRLRQEAGRRLAADLEALAELIEQGR